MASYRIAANMEFVRSADKGFEEGIKIAAELGYEWVEPMVHTGWELLSEVHYFHSFSMEEDPLLMREICDRYGVKVSSISGHSPLMKPEAAVPRLTRAIVLADAVGAGFVNSDEMVKPDWMDDAHAHEVMRYSLEKAALVAARHGVYVCIEPHGIYTQTSEGLLRIVDLVPSPWIQVNWDTGNAYIAGAEDPYEGLERALSSASTTSTPRTSPSSRATPGARSRAPRSGAPAARAWSTGSGCSTSWTASTGR